MNDLSALADDAIVDALLMEVAGLLDRLIKHGQPGTVDLQGMPLSASCLSTLEQKLGRGEVTAQLSAAGRSDIHETSFPGVWWTRHADEGGRVIALLIEVAPVPAILCASSDDMAAGLLRLPGCTSFSQFSRAGHF